MNIRLILTLVFLAIGSNSYSQKAKDSLLAVWNNKKISDSIRVNAYHIYISTYYLNKKNDSAEVLSKSLYKFVLKQKLNKKIGNVELLIGETKFATTKSDEALKYYKKALLSFRTNKDLKGESSALLRIGHVYGNYFKYDQALNYFDKSLKISESINDSMSIAKIMVSIGNVYSGRFKFKESTEYFLKGLNICQLLNNEKSQALIYAYIGSNYDLQKDYINSYESYIKSLEISTKYKDLKNQRRTLFYLSSSFLNQKKYKESVKFAHKSLDLDKTLGSAIFSRTNHYNLAEAYKELNNTEMAFKHLEKATSLENEIQQFNANKKLQDLEISQIRREDSLKNIAKELKATIAHKEEKTNLILAWGGSLSALSICAFLIFRNIKRKQRMAEKERQEQIEEKEKILKDLELSTIDAMIKGQEKERERLAADLHDSVGATLTAAKLQFDYLIKNKDEAKYSEELIKKTSTLLEDAYVEIRSMAHLKNSGVMAKNGLLPAVEKLSSNASGINGLTFEVQSFGLDQRLENALEISIFRIIQELVTNVIKHANATKGIVHLTNHDDNLNIMIEDNGIGFNPKQISKTKVGMGISSIDKRVEHLDGKLTIESEKNKGTTVIIDIPL